MPDLENDLLILLSDVARHMRTYGDQLAQQHGVTLVQLRILERLKREPDISQNELAAITELSPMTVARLVHRTRRARTCQTLRRSRRPTHVAFTIDACRCAAGAAYQDVASQTLPCWDKRDQCQRSWHHGGGAAPAERKREQPAARQASG